MMKFNEGVYQAIGRIRKDGPREPLRTVTELAEEFGISKQALGMALAKPGAPSPVLDYRRKNVVLRAKWFRPSEVRAWWKERQNSSLQDEQSGTPNSGGQS